MERKHPLAKCEECPLYEKGKFVPSSIPANSNGIAFIGESPGNEEKTKGKVFIGRSGKLLDKVLEHHGVDRSRSLLTNGALCNYRVEDKDSLPGAIEACRPRLLAELDESGIETAVTLGNSAAKALIDTKSGITKLRGGDPKPDSYGAGIKVVPTFHPAYTLRDQSKFPLLVADIAKVNPRKKIWREPKVTIITETERAKKFLEGINSKFPLYFDVENGVEKEKSYAHDTRLLCVGIGSSAPNHGDRVVVIGAPAVTQSEVLDAMYDCIERVGGIICQNGKHDVRVMEETNTKQQKIYLAGDTMLASYALNENPGSHSLKYMIMEHLGGPDYEATIRPYLVKPKDPPEKRQPAIEYLMREMHDEEGNRRIRIRPQVLKVPDGIDEKAVKHVAEEMGMIEFKDESAGHKANQIRWMLPKEPVQLAPPEADGSYASIPPDLLYLYNGYDVQGTRQLDQEYLQPLIDEEGLRECYDHLIDMSNALARPERPGITVDYDENNHLDKKFEEEEELVGNFDFNPKSPQQVHDYFLSEFGLDLEKTDKDTLLAIKGAHNEDEPVVTLIDRLLEFKRVTKYRSTYVTSIRNQALLNDGRVLPTFKIDQATTGRLASKNPNVQNMPRKFDIKKQFIPGNPDRVFVHADMAQLELRVITWLSGDEGMRELFNDPNRDLFDELTMIVYGMGKDEFYEKKNRGALEITEKRVIIKAFAYGIILDRSAEGIAADSSLGLDIDSAREKMGIFKKQIPGIVKYQAQVKRDVLSGKDLINVFGRRRRFHVITNESKKELLRQAVAFQPQSTASDIVVRALGRLPSFLDPRNIIHDAILIEAPRDEAIEHGRILMRTMIEAAEEITKGWIKFDAEATWGNNWMEAAKPKEDKSNLITLD